MKDTTTGWKVPKWPFLLGTALLLAVAGFLFWQSPRPLDRLEIVTAAACVALGAIIGAMPFYFDYHAIIKVVDASAVGAIAEKIQNLEHLVAQISSATNEWTNAQMQAEKTSTAAKEIADKMAAEVREFAEFMKKMNDSEKAALRLEVEKFRRGEAEWLQVLVHILDHIFALHAAAAHSGQTRLVEQLTQFQNACRDVARRVGLTPFAAAPDEPFDAERHQAVGIESEPSSGAVVVETIGQGYTFQGRKLRPVLVRLRDGNTPVETQSEKPAAAAPSAPENAEGGLSLELPN